MYPLVDSSVFGRTTSKAHAGRDRITKGFESYKEAELRTSLEREKISKGLKRPRTHIGSNYKWRAEECLEKVFVIKMIQ